MIRPTFLVLLLIPTVALAVDVRVEGPEGLEDDYRRTVSRLVGDVEQALGFTYQGRVRVRLAQNEKEFRRWVGERPEWVAAVGLPRDATLVVRLASVGPERGLAINAVLRHELVHVLLPERLSWRARLPLWFEEGLAQVVGGRINRADVDRLPVVAAAGNLIPLKEISRRFPEDRARAALAYAQGESLVQYFLSRYGHDGLKSLLSATAREGSFEAALEEEVGLTQEDLEEDWRDWLVDEKPWWLVILSGAFLPLLFFIASLLVIVAFLRMRRRRKETYDSLEEG